MDRGGRPDSGLTGRDRAAAGGPGRLDRTRNYRLRQEAIVRSAVDVLNRKGVRGMTLADVAAKLQLVPTGIIYYFANKEELAAACFLDALKAYDGLIEEAARNATPECRLAAFVRGFVRFRRDVATGAANDIAVFNDVRALRDPTVNQVYIDVFRRTRALLSPSSSARAMRAAANARAHHVLSQLFWAIAWLPRYHPEDFERAGEWMLDILSHGIRGPGRIWAPTPLPTPESRASEEVSRETFLRAATELINEQGYHGASVEKISARLKVTKGSFYHHIGAKDDLVVACFERTVQVMRDAQRSAERSGGSGWDRLCSTSAALVDYQIRGGAPFLRTSALTSAPEVICTQMITKFNRVSDSFAAVISDGIADGSIRPVDANICAQMITGMLNAAAELGFWAGGLPPTELTRAFLQPLFDGMAT